MTSGTTHDNVATTTYQGNTTTVQEPGGQQPNFNHRHAGPVDSGDRGPPDSLRYNTFHSYDELDDLTRVCQNGVNDATCTGGQQRTFTYDFVKRLQYATNPESGQIGNTYDANGNVKTRTDARGIATTYNYDAVPNA